MKLFHLIMLLSISITTVAEASRTVAAAEPIILHVDGKTGDGLVHDFTRSDLEALGLATIRTSTPWYDNAQTFEGVPLEAVLRTVGARGDKLIVTAINRYLAEIPIEEVGRLGIILAMKRNGVEMEVKDKGPLFVIYPFDQNPDLKSELYYGRSVWQVRAITIEWTLRRSISLSK